MRIQQHFLCLVFCIATWGGLLSTSEGVEPSPSPPPHTSSSNSPAKNQTNPLIDQGQTLFQEGNALFEAENFSQALDAYQKALHYFQVSDRQMEGETRVQIGLCYAYSGQYSTGLAFLEEAFTIFQDILNREDEGKTLTYIGIVHFMYCRYEEALKVFEQALRLTREIHDRLVEGRILNQLGETCRSLGQFKQALTYYQQALSIDREFKDEEGEGVNQANIGSVHVGLGEYTEAFQAYQKALSILSRVGDLQGMASIYISLGATYIRLGDYQKALQNFEEAQNVLKGHEIEEQRYKALALTGIGVVSDNRCQEHLAHCFKALAAYQDALRIQKKIIDRAGQGNTLHNIGNGYGRLGEEATTPQYHKQALQFYQKSLAITEESKELALQANTLNNVGEAYIHLSFHENKEEYLEKAMASLQKALAIRRKIGDRGGEWRSLSNIGWVLEGQGKLEEALKTDLQAIELLEQIITSVGGVEEFKAGLSAQAAETYQRTVLLLMRLGDPEQAFEFSEHARARVLLDQLGNTRLHARDKANEALTQQEHRVRLELNEVERRLKEQLSRLEAQQDHELINFLKQQRTQKQNAYEELLLQLKVSNPEYVSLVRVDPLTLGGLQQLLRQRQHRLKQEMILLSYFVTPESTLAFIISPDSFITEKLPVSESELTRAIATFQNFAASDESTSNVLEDLYTWLIAPIKQHLTTPLIGIIPHGILHYLPFATLSDSKHYLHDEYTLFYLPSASVLQFIQPKPQADEKPDEKPILAMAYSKTDKAEKLQFLPYTEQEVQGISKLFKTTALTGDDATEVTFRKQAGDFFILHLAAHGVLNPTSPLLSHIVLAPDKAGEHDGRLEVHEVYELNLEHTDLVVLSACETKLGKQSRGDDIIGLNRAFLYAGTPSVIATLWKVNDFTTQEFMIAFYQQLKQGKSKAEALRTAQQKIRSEYPHPYYWAGFVLTGDPGTTSTQVPWMYILGIGLIGGGILAILLLKMKRK